MFTSQLNARKKLHVWFLFVLFYFQSYLLMKQLPTIFSQHLQSFNTKEKNQPSSETILKDFQLDIVLPKLRQERIKFGSTVNFCLSWKNCSSNLPSYQGLQMFMQQLHFSMLFPQESCEIWQDRFFIEWICELQRAWLWRGGNRVGKVSNFILYIARLSVYVVLSCAPQYM